MGNLFGYPEFDENGEKILTTYDNDYKDMLMDIRVYRMKAGDTKEFFKPEEEMAVLLIKGELTYKWGQEEKKVYRKDVFTDGLYALHVCKGTKVTVTAGSDAEILVQCTDNVREFDAKFYDPENTPWIYSCKDKFGGTAKRRVNTAFDYETAPYSNMVLGEVLNDPGNWSGYIPHTHPQPETYYFLFLFPADSLRICDALVYFIFSLVRMSELFLAFLDLQAVLFGKALLLVYPDRNACSAVAE